MNTYKFMVALQNGKSLPIFTIKLIGKRYNNNLITDRRINYERQ